MGQEVGKNSLLYTLLDISVISCLAGFSQGILPTLGWKYRVWGTPWARDVKWSLVCPFTVTSAHKIRVTFSEFGVASSPTTIETVDNSTFGG